MTDRPATPLATLEKARNIGLEEGLLYVYEGNIPGRGGENTFCPACKAEVISRFGFSISAMRLEHGRCAQCGQAISGVW